MKIKVVKKGTTNAKPRQLVPAFRYGLLETKECDVSTNYQAEVTAVRGSLAATLR